MKSNELKVQWVSYFGWVQYRGIKILSCALGGYSLVPASWVPLDSAPDPNWDFQRGAADAYFTDV